MTNPRDILNKVKWKKDYDFNLIEIYYLHRGAPQDTKIISGKEILKLEKSFIKTNTTMIPYHRVLKIVCLDKILFKR